MLPYFIVRAPIGQVLSYGTVVSKYNNVYKNVTALVCDPEDGDDYVVLVRASDNGAILGGDSALINDRLLAEEFAQYVTRSGK